jgi:hypothetical protein
LGLFCEFQLAERRRLSWLRAAEEQARETPGPAPGVPPCISSAWKNQVLPEILVSGLVQRGRLKSAIGLCNFPMSRST